MIILYWMSPEPVVAREEMTLLEAQRLMQQHQVRRLPVVRGDDELCGIIGISDLLRLLPPAEPGEDLSDAATAELSRQTVGSRMVHTPHTCDAYDHLEVVSEKMRRLKVGAFPVLSRGHLVGMISETDLLRALEELSYYGGGGKRITLRIPEEQEIDVLYHIVDLSRRSALELLCVLTHPILDESALMATLRVRGRNVDGFVRTLWDAGYKVADVS